MNSNPNTPVAGRYDDDSNVCKAPGCKNPTERDICDDCDQWITDMVRKERSK